MDAIAETSSVSKATIYKHWADKDALARCQAAGGKSCETVANYCSPNPGLHTWVGLAISMETKPKVGISWGAPAQTTANAATIPEAILYTRRPGMKV